MKFYIWSYRNRSWWGPDHSGYTKKLIDETGQYTLDEAADITIANCLPGANVAVDVNLKERFIACASAEEVESELEELRRI